MGWVDGMEARLDKLVAERAAVEAELAELEKGTPVFDRDCIEFWVREIVGKKDSPEVIALFVRRVVLDRENGRSHVEFVVGGEGGGTERTPGRAFRTGVAMRASIVLPVCERECV